MPRQESEVMEALKAVRDEAESLETSRSTLKSSLLLEVSNAIENFEKSNGEFSASIKNVFTLAAALGGRFRFRP